MTGKSSQNLDRLIRLARKAPATASPSGDAVDPVAVAHLATRVAAHWAEMAQAERPGRRWDRLSAIAAAASLTVAVLVQFDSRRHPAATILESQLVAELDPFSAMASSEPEEGLP